MGEVLADAPAQPQGLADRRPGRRDLLLVHQPAIGPPPSAGPTTSAIGPSQAGRLATKSSSSGQRFTSGLGRRYSIVSAVRNSSELRLERHAFQPGQRRLDPVHPHDRRRPDHQLAVGGQDVEQVDPVAEPVAIRPSPAPPGWSSGDSPGWSGPRPTAGPSGPRRPSPTPGRYSSASSRAGRGGA